MGHWGIYFGYAFFIVISVVGCRTEELTSPLPMPLVSPLVTLQPTSQDVSDWPRGQILYHANKTGAYQIYMREDDQAPILLTENLSSAVEGSWSSDGKKIAFAASSGPDTIKIYTVRAGGTDLMALPIEQPYLNWYPKWSPDGQELLFVSNRDGNFEIYKVSLYSNFFNNITGHPDNDQEPDWSPDGEKIVFVSDRGEGDGLYSMDADGNNVQLLLDGAWGCRHPHWSPSGQQIAFSAKFAGINHIYIINRDGSDMHKITDRTGDNVMPSWVGDDRIIFSGVTGDMTWNLFIIDVDGSDLKQLTETPYSERYPQWYP